MTFRKCMWSIFLGAVALTLTVHAPSVVVSQMVNREAAAWLAAAEVAFDETSTYGDVSVWLTESGYLAGMPLIVFPEPPMADDSSIEPVIESGIEAMPFEYGVDYYHWRMLAKGTCLWDAATLHLRFFYDDTGRYQRHESFVVAARPTVGSGWVRPIPGVGTAPSTWIVSASSWLPPAALLLVVALNAHRYMLRSLREEHGKCIKCGYDLRVDLAAGCPECGWGREEAKA